MEFYARKLLENKMFLYILLKVEPESNSEARMRATGRHSISVLSIVLSTPRLLPDTKMQDLCRNFVF